MAVRIIATVIGGALGFAYYKFIGCRTGACPLTSNPYISIIWGALIGFIISG
ncbi:MAG: YtxH domain-containing protein [Candidatus Marinimicrobia bacterium]|nr:YtxH domain-containing protein [Candidatus Neomarinimicrobiota bacterium]